MKTLGELRSRKSKFSERLSKNAKPLMLWIFEKVDKVTKKICAWRIRHGLHSSIEYTASVAVVLFFLIAVLPVLMFWAILKSI